MVSAKAKAKKQQKKQKSAGQQENASKISNETAVIKKEKPVQENAPKIKKEAPVQQKSKENSKKSSVSKDHSPSLSHKIPSPTMEKEVGHPTYADVAIAAVAESKVSLKPKDKPIVAKSSTQSTIWQDFLNNLVQNKKAYTVGFLAAVFLIPFFSLVFSVFFTIKFYQKIVLPKLNDGSLRVPRIQEIVSFKYASPDKTVEGIDKISTLVPKIEFNITAIELVKSQLKEQFEPFLTQIETSLQQNLQSVQQLYNQTRDSFTTFLDHGDSLGINKEEFQKKLRESKKKNQYVNQPLQEWEAEQKQLEEELRLLKNLRKQKKLKPIIGIPGYTSSTLELWEGKDCYSNKAAFREKLYGGVSMITKMFINRQCYLEHMALNKTTFLDPEGIKLRNSEGLYAGDYIFPGFWIWGKMVEVFSDFGYEPNNFVLAPYDWRLGFEQLEKRDKFLTQLKLKIETMRKLHDEKVVIITHSLGGKLFYYFLNWVENNLSDDDKLILQGKGALSWTDYHVDSFVSLGGPFLGVSKSITALLSGEMRDTVMLNDYYNVLDKFFSKQQRASIFRTWSSILELFPLGNNDLWKNDYMLKAFKKEPKTNKRSGVVTKKLKTLERKNKSKSVTEIASKNETSLTAKDAKEERRLLRKKKNEQDVLFEDLVPFLQNATDPFLAEHLNNYTFYVPQQEIEDFETEIPEAVRKDPKNWGNALRTSLPNAPNMTIYAIYGTHLSTEYNYKVGPGTKDDGVNYKINKIREEPLGDGTVPFISLAYVPRILWRTPRYNPHGVRIVVREYEESNFDDSDKQKMKQENEAKELAKKRAASIVAASIQEGESKNVLLGELAKLDKFGILRMSGSAVNHVDIIGNNHVFKDIIFAASKHNHLVKDKMVVTDYKFSSTKDEN